VIRRRRKPTYGLALSGGAALGAYQAGAVRAFYEAGLNVRVVAGSSVGALNGYLAATGEIDAMVSFWQNLDQKKLITMDSFTKLFFTPMPSILTDRIQRDLVEKQVRAAQLKASGRDFICTAISLNTGKLHYFAGNEAHSDADLQRMILASAAVPGVFPPVEIGNELFMDGGLVRNTPIEALETRKLDTVIGISMEPESYTSEPINNAAAIALRTVSIFFRTQASDALERSLHSKKRKARRVLLLRPHLPLDMQQYEFDPKKIAGLLTQGYDEAKAFMRQHKLR